MRRHHDRAVERDVERSAADDIRVTELLARRQVVAGQRSVRRVIRLAQHAPLLAKAQHAPRARRHVPALGSGRVQHANPGRLGTERDEPRARAGLDLVHLAGYPPRLLPHAVGAVDRQGREVRRHRGRVAGRLPIRGNDLVRTDEAPEHRGARQLATQSVGNAQNRGAEVGRLYRDVLARGGPMHPRVQGRAERRAPDLQAASLRSVPARGNQQQLGAVPFRRDARAESRDPLPIRRKPQRQQVGRPTLGIGRERRHIQLPHHPQLMMGLIGGSRHQHEHG